MSYIADPSQRIVSYHPKLRKVAHTFYADSLP